MLADIAIDFGVYPGRDLSFCKSLTDFGGTGRIGFVSEEADSGLIALSGGSLHVSAGGDGLDSNGSISVSGGTLLVVRVHSERIYR